MPEMLSKLGQQISDFWKNLDKSQKTRIYITAGILLTAIIISVFYLTRPNHVTIVSGADQKEVAEMQKILNDKKIWNKLSADGTGLVVNMNDKDAAKFELGVSGYPKGGVSFADAYKYIKINTTESDKQKIWKEYELASLKSQLMMFKNVKDVKIQITTPERSLFLDPNNEQLKPSAAVTVIPSGEIDAKQAKSMVMVIARSVEGLKPEDVTLVDDSGNNLNTETGNDELGKTSTQYDMKLKVKNVLENSVKDIFNGQMDGFDSIKTVANPILDFNSQKSQIQDVKTPEGMDNGAEISKETKSTDLVNYSQNGEPGLGTNPGTVNAPSYPLNNGQDSTLKEKQEKVNRKFTETYTEQQKALGEMLPEKSTFAATLLYGKRVADDSKLTPEFMDQVKDTISKATGIPIKNITVTKMKLAPDIVATKPFSETLKEYASAYGLPLILLIMFLALVISVLPRRRRRSEPELAMAQAEGASTPRFIVPEAPMEPLPEIDLEERSEVKKQIEKFVKQKPDAVAQLLRNWLSDEWD